MADPLFKLSDIVDPNLVPASEKPTGAAPAFAEPTTPSGTPTPLPTVAPGVPTEKMYAAYPERKYDTPAGEGVGTYRLNPAVGARAFRLTNEMPAAQQLQAREDIYTTVEGRPPPVTVEQIKDIQDPGMLETLIGWLEPFDAVRRGAWWLGGVAASALPNVDTRAGQLAQTAAQKVGEVGGAATGHFYSMLPGQDMAPEYPALMGQIFSNAYKAAADGDLLTEWANTPGFYYESFKRPNADSILNRVVPKDLAEATAKAAPSALKPGFKMLESDTGRAIASLVLELGTDPLMFAGGAGGSSRVIAVGDDTFRLSSKGVSAADAVTKSSRGVTVDEALRTVVKASGESGAARNAARQTLLEAEAAATQRALAAETRAASLRAGMANPAKTLADLADDAERNFVALKAAAKANPEAARALPAAEEALTAMRRRVAQTLASPAKAAKGIEQMAKGLEKTAATEKASAAAVRSVLDASAAPGAAVVNPLFGAGKTIMARGGIVSKEGALAVHVPFGKTTYYLLPKAALSPVAKLGKAASKSYEPYKLANLEARIAQGVAVGMPPNAVLDKGEQLAWVAQKLGKPVGDTYRLFHDLVATTLGGRWIQPMVMKLTSLNDAQRAKLNEMYPVSRVMFQRWMALEKAAPELWQSYQNAVERFFQQAAAQDQYLHRSMSSIIEKSQALAKTRKAMAKAGKLSAWETAKYGDPTYGAQDVIDEVMGAVESGADVLTPGTSYYRADLAALAPEIDKLIGHIQQTMGKSSEEVVQSVVAMARFLHGDIETERLLSEAAGELDTLGTMLGRTRQSVQQQLKALAPTVEARAKWLQSALTELDPAAVGTAVDRYLARTGGKAVTAEMLRNTILGIVKDPAQVNDVLRRIAMAHGKTAPADGLNILAGTLTGRIAGSPGVKVAQAMQNLMASNDETIRLAQALREGNLTTKQQADALLRLAKSAMTTELAQARALLGEDGFLKAAGLIEALDEPNIVPALMKVTGKSEQDVTSGVAALMRGMENAKKVGAVAEGNMAKLEQAFAEIGLPPGVVDDAFLRATMDPTLVEERLRQAILRAGPNAEQAIYERLKLAAVDGRTSQTVDAFTDSHLRNAARQIVASVRRTVPSVAPEEAALSSVQLLRQQAEADLASAKTLLAETEREAAPLLAESEIAKAVARESQTEAAAVQAAQKELNATRGGLQLKKDMPIPPPRVPTDTELHAIPAVKEAMSKRVLAGLEWNDALDEANRLGEALNNLKPRTAKKVREAASKAFYDAVAKADAARAAVDDAEIAYQAARNVTTDAFGQNTLISRAQKAQLAMDEAARAMREVEASVRRRLWLSGGQNAAAAVTSAKAEVLRAEQRVRDLVVSEQQAVKALDAAKARWTAMMQGYASMTTGVLRDAFDALSKSLPDARRVDQLRQADATVAAAQKEVTTAQEALKTARKAGAGAQIPTSIPEGFRASQAIPEAVAPVKVVYVSATDAQRLTGAARIPQGANYLDVLDNAGNVIDNVPIVSLQPTAQSTAVQLATDGTVALGTTRQTAPISPAYEAVMDYMRANPPVEPSGKIALRHLETWETTLWSQFRALTQGMDDERVLEAAMLALRHAPDYGKDALKAIKGVTPQRLGTRFGGIDPELRPLVEEMTGLLKSYERMYVAHGMDFIADPMRMMRDWGVMAYVPHIPVQRNLIAMGKFSANTLARGTAGRAPGFASIDSALTTDMAARHERRLAGTIAEINKTAQDPTSVLTLEPSLIVGRYAQANGALNAQDFLVMLMRTGVMKAIKATTTESIEQIAMREQLVPLFTRPSLTRDMDLLLGADAAAWRGAGVTPGELDAARAAIKEWAQAKKGALKDISPFATWLREVPAIQQAINIEEVLLDIRAFQYNAGGALLDIRGEFDALAAAAAAAGQAVDSATLWKQVTTKVNRLAADAGSEIRVDPKMLMTWFDEGKTSWQLYVPATVAQSMIDTLDFGAYAERVLDTKLGAVKKFADGWNNLYKGWYTITQLMHHAGNAIGNVFNNALDLGVMGALNPKTNLIATQLTHAAAYVDEYGSLSAAAAALEAPMHATESAWAFSLRKGRLASFNAMGLAKALEQGIDLGDGIVREADTAMRLMKEQGVFTGGHNVYLDLDRFEQETAELYSLMHQPELIQNMKRTALAARDVVIATLPVAFTGGIAGLGVVVPPRIGRMIASFVENQSRASNFVANLRRSGSIEQSAQHVNKFLFNYADLTAAQKIWMRTIFPFFTWTFKNAYLQAEMLRNRPYFYQTFSQMLLIHAPEIVDAYERDIGFKGRYPAHPWSSYAVRWRQPHARFRLRLPIPEYPTLYLEGFRTPIESATETLSMVAEAAGGVPQIPAMLAGEGPEAALDQMSRFRILSQMHFGARFMFEKAFGWNVYYNRPLYQLDNAKPIGQTLAALQKTYTAGVPVLSAVAGRLHNALANTSGYSEVTAYNPYKDSYESVARVKPGFVHTFMNMPYGQYLRTLMGVSDVYQTSIADTSLTEIGTKELIRVPFEARYFDALTGVGLTQEDPMTRIKMVEREARDMQLKAMEAGGGVLTYQQPYISKR